jgi:hypothetical protein
MLSQLTTRRRCLTMIGASRWLVPSRRKLLIPIVVASLMNVGTLMHAETLLRVNGRGRVQDGQQEVVALMRVETLMYVVVVARMHVGD